MKKLRDMVDPKHFCHQATQPKMLALLKKTFIEPVGSSDVALRDRILSMDDGFEFLFVEPQLGGVFGGRFQNLQFVHWKGFLADLRHGSRLCEQAGAGASARAFVRKRAHRID